MNNLVIYDKRVRWVAVLNLAFAFGGIYFGFRFVSGIERWIMVGFLALFSLIWIKDFLFGYRLKLVSNGRVLEWQDGKHAASVEIRNITRIKAEEASSSSSDEIRKWVYITLELANGDQKSLPPHIAFGLQAWDWKLLRRLVEHLRTISPGLPVKGIPGFDESPSNARDEFLAHEIRDTRHNKSKLKLLTVSGLILLILAAPLSHVSLWIGIPLAVTGLGVFGYFQWCIMAGRHKDLHCSICKGRCEVVGKNERGYLFRCPKCGQTVVVPV